MTDVPSVRVVSNAPNGNEKRQALHEPAACTAAKCFCCAPAVGQRLWVRIAPWLVTFVIVIAAVGQFGGGTEALIMYNYWMRSFTSGNAAVAVQFISAIFYFVLFVPMWAVALAWQARRILSAQPVEAGDRSAAAGEAPTLLFAAPLSPAVRRLWWRRVLGLLFDWRLLSRAMIMAVANLWINLASSFAVWTVTPLTQAIFRALLPAIMCLASGLFLEGDVPWWDTLFGARPSSWFRVAKLRAGACLPALPGCCAIPPPPTKDDDEKQEAAEPEAVTSEFLLGEDRADRLRRFQVDPEASLGRQCLSGARIWAPPVLALVFCLTAVFLHVAEKASQAEETAWGYVFLYFTATVGVAPYAFGEALYLRDATIAAKTVAADVTAAVRAEHAAEHGDEEAFVDADGQPLADLRGDDVVPPHLLRLHLLAFDMAMVLVLTFALGPLLSMIPAFGINGGAAALADVPEAERFTYAAQWRAAGVAFKCLFTCPTTFGYMVATLIGWAFMYGADTVLNHFNPTLNMIIYQLTSPLTALVLLLAPQWDLYGTRPKDLSFGDNLKHLFSTNDGWMQIISIVLLFSACALYTFAELRNGNEHAETLAKKTDQKSPAPVSEEMKEGDM